MPDLPRPERRHRVTRAAAAGNPALQVWHAGPCPPEAAAPTGGAGLPSSLGGNSGQRIRSASTAPPPKRRIPLPLRPLHVRDVGELLNHALLHLRSRNEADASRRLRDALCRTRGPPH